MKITVTRKQFNDTSTQGTLEVDGYTCVTLEDKDRGLDSNMPISEIKAKKVYAQTAIPTGTYKIEKLWWAKFGKFYPHLLNVPGFEGVLIHSGRNHNDTEGCILVGTVDKGEDSIDGGFVVMDKLRELIFGAIEKGEEVYLTVEREQPVNV